MPIQRLKISNLRNLGSVDLSPNPKVNFLYGANGSGKTSILEAIHFIGMGRSFRSHRIKPIISKDTDTLVLFAKLLDLDSNSTSIGLQRSTSQDSLTKINGKAILSAAELANQLPIQLIDAHSFALIEGPPKLRRNFLDWLVFHVKPNFYSLWKGYSQALKQRNSLLRRDRIQRHELEPWDKELCRYSEEIRVLRQECFTLLKSVLLEVINDFQVLDDLDISFYPGWDKDSALAEVLDQGFERDSRLGYSWYGAHKAEVRIKIGGFAADQALSRGQQKLLICAMKIAIGKVYSRHLDRPCVYLIDDLPSELDDTNQQRLAQWLLDIGAQVFVTAVSKEPLIKAWPQIKEYSVFHVEHGTINNELQVTNELGCDTA